ncbi:glycoside hydrolase family 43 protein [Hirschia litorea]|uniref:Glycoside hydrolase family 43 protein n=1 Tax=Hirschia litorea TaxID=1199156 RepID=A0ABW2IPQ0_9PROT
MIAISFIVLSLADAWFWSWIIYLAQAYEAENSVLKKCVQKKILRNPILRGFNPDPSICRVGDTYYIATSTFEWFPGVQIFASTDLEDWKLVSRPLDSARLLDMRGVPDSCGVWAPALSYADGKFWLLYTNVRRFDGDFKDTPNFLTTCEEIDGEWSDPIYINASGFDPSLFHDDDGRKWVVNMVWDHRHNHSYFKGIVLQEYSVEMRKVFGPRKMIFQGSEAGYTEGPHLYKINGEYYLITAEGGTGYNHAVSVCRSDKIDGPYEIDPAMHVITAQGQAGKPIQRTGHGGLVDTPEGRWFLTHLCSRPIPGTRLSPMGRETAIQEVYFDDDGWIRLRHPDIAFEIKSLNEDEKQLIRYSFDGEKLHSDFAWLRTPYPERLFSLSAREGCLRLIGRESPGSLFEQSIVARRQTEHCYQATTIIEFDPDSFQQMAGLIAYYNQHKFHYLFISYDDENGKTLQVMSCAGDLSLHARAPMGLKPVSIPEGVPIHMKVDVKFDVLTFYWSLDGGDWTRIGPTLDASALSDEAGKGEGANFTGAFVGMACHDVTGIGLHADFSAFSYAET